MSQIIKALIAIPFMISGLLAISVLLLVGIPLPYLALADFTSLGTIRIFIYGSAIHACAWAILWLTIKLDEKGIIYGWDNIVAYAFFEIMLILFMVILSATEWTW
jgi:hypothetical protein